MSESALVREPRRGTGGDRNLASGVQRRPASSGAAAANAAGLSGQLGAAREGGGLTYQVDQSGGPVKGMAAPTLVREPRRGAGSDRSLAGGLQRRPASSGTAAANSAGLSGQLGAP